MDFVQVGQFIRKVRKERGMTLDDLADTYIPRATLSSIERGISQNPTKINYLLRKLDVHLVDLSKQEQIDREDRNLHLIILESKINRAPAAILKELISLPTNHQGSFSIFLKGRCYFKLKQYDQAIECFKNALHLAERELDSERANLKTYCCNHLSIIAFQHKNYEQALQYTDEGIAALNLNGERTYYYFTLLLNRAIYLWNLGKTEEALKTLEQIEMKTFDLNIDTVIGIYDFRAKLKLEIKLVEDATYCAKKGLELARINDNYERQLELFITLSEIYKTSGFFNRAEQCLQTAISLQDMIVKRHNLILIAYLDLGILYHEQQKYQQSQKILQKVLQIAKQQNNMLKYTKAMLYLAKNSLSKSRYDESIVCFTEVLNHSTDKEIKLEAYYGLAKLYLHLGDNENYTKFSKQYFENA